MTAPTQIRVDLDVKSEATALFKSLGLDMSSAVNLFLHQCVLRGGLPFNVEVPRYSKQTLDAMEEARQILLDTLQHCSAQELKEWGTLKNKLRDVLSDYIYGKTKRSPMILPIIMEV